MSADGGGNEFAADDKVAKATKKGTKSALATVPFEVGMCMLRVLHGVVLLLYGVALLSSNFVSHSCSLSA